MVHDIPCGSRTQVDNHCTEKRLGNHANNNFKRTLRNAKLQKNMGFKQLKLLRDDLHFCLNGKFCLTFHLLV